MIHHVLLYGGSIAIVVMFAVVVGAFESYLPKHRSDYELCQDVTEEVNIQVDEGMLTQQQADDISDRCFRQFGGNNEQ